MIIAHMECCPVVWKALHTRRDPASWSPAELGYLAGLFDGEGNFTLALNKRTGTLKAVLRIAITHEDVTLWLVDHFGGGASTSIWKANVGSRRYDCLGYRWTAYGQEAVDITHAILPYMIVKPDEGLLLIEAWETRQPLWGAGRGHHKPMTPEIYARRADYCRRLIEMRAAKKATIYAAHPRSRVAR